MNKPWSKLPNAHHIDWVIKSLRGNPRLWIKASMTWDAARAAAWRAARDAAKEARAEAWNAAEGASWNAPEAPLWRAAWYEAWKPAISSILALIVYDDCDQYLSMSYKELQIWAALSEHPAAVLLLPMVYVREKINEPALV